MAEITNREFATDKRIVEPKQRVVQRILRHLGLPTDAPEARPARAPPGQLATTDDQTQGGPDFDAAC